MRMAGRVAAVTAGSLVLAGASTVVAGTRLEVQDWDCPPAPASCARPVEVRGFPLPFVSDYHGISPVGRASLVGALLGEDLFRARAFWVDVACYAAGLAALWAAGTRLTSRRARR
jgi:hypothetical protein